MNFRRISKVAVMVIAVSLIWAGSAFAGAVSLQLVRSTLTNVDDAAGRWQHEGGTIQKSGATVGEYAIHRRVTTGGTTAQNTAMETVTLFFTRTGTPPQNVTMQGAHSFSNGYFKGSVSAAAANYNWIQGADAVIVPTKTVGTSNLTIRWTASGTLTLP